MGRMSKNSKLGVQVVVDHAENKTSVESIVDAAQELLSKRYGGRQELLEIEQLNGSGTAIVLRARVAPSPFLQQRSVVLKYIPPTGRLIDESTLMREVVSYQFTTSLSEEVRPGPVLLAYDVDEHILVISDSGDGDTFADLLDSSNADLRIEILRNLGEAIGKLHVGTASKEQDFDILLHRMLTKYPEITEMHDFRERLLRMYIEVSIKLIEQQGIVVPEVVKEFADNARRRLTSGQHRAFTPFDLSPDNIIVSDKTHFLDYEWAGFRDAAFDVACVVAGFPQFLFARPVMDDEADIFIDSWAQQVAGMWPNVRNLSRLHARILTALVGWAFSSVAMMHMGYDNEAFEDLYQGMVSDGAESMNVDAIVSRLTTSGNTLLHDIFHISDEEDEENAVFDEDREALVLIRRDLYETFEALYRFARRESDSRFPVVADFAGKLVEKLD